MTLEGALSGPGAGAARAGNGWTAPVGKCEQRGGCRGRRGGCQPRGRRTAGRRRSSGRVGPNRRRKLSGGGKWTGALELRAASALPRAPRPLESPGTGIGSNGAGTSASSSRGSSPSRMRVRLQVAGGRSELRLPRSVKVTRPARSRRGGARQFVEPSLPTDASTQRDTIRVFVGRACRTTRQALRHSACERDRRGGPSPMRKPAVGRVDPVVIYM
jgi:hypothetical protein